ncbi:MAG: acylneuraminate cytidylyltransferase family protein [Candidatus Micrarchaeota archaeon]|nr:acylneuraminate cytidylyltransferase family protein [Candidatus Micrarchaeota archaeon]
MTSAICFIPIKTVSKRVHGKNFKLFCGHPLYKYIITSAIHSKAFDEVYVDTDSDEIKEFSSSVGAKIIDRPEHMTGDNINGNHLLVYDYGQVKKGDFLFQLFATAPMLTAESIAQCVNTLKQSKDHDSIFTATDECGWFWFRGKPVNYKPKELPRSQDAEHVVKESTGLYGITRDALLKTKCRIGEKPKMFIIPHEESVDIDSDLEFQFAEHLGKTNNRGKIIRN